ncbi:hypothetical protein F4780DRAFT_78310 [Xylariomycetidae sp. FL0641]|nr:hypothetical protein F4780DRAFT_78310 [Xylariomycetidae sp. FL0641]
MQHIDGGQAIKVFEGALSFRVVHLPHRAFAFEVTLQLDSPLLAALAAAKPPLHFHPYQAEYVEVLEGRCVVEVGGQEHPLGPGNGEFCVRAGEHHRWYPILPSENGDAGHREGTVARVLISGEDSTSPFRLDWLFFENWYGYQNQFVLNGEIPDLIQVLCMFDAGGSYPSLPGWLPCGRRISIIGSIVLGRWLGGLLGYQPYYHKWTTDWQLARSRMESTWAYKGFVDDKKKDK